MSSPRSPFRPDIEGLRGAAILLVVLFHAGVPVLAGGFVGVDLFFVLSGYFITGLLVREQAQSGTVSLPEAPELRYTAPKAKPGVATMVLFARPTPLDVPDDAVKGWFERLPELSLPAGGDRAAVWFDDYAEARDPLRPRTFGEVGSDDPFARWQGQLRKALGGKAAFETAVSFARTGGK